MAEQITVNLENLSEAERSQLMQMVEKANKPKTKVWKPVSGENYWFIDNDCTFRFDNWVDYVIDKKRWKLGNVYKTREQAQFASEKQMVLTELQRYAAEHNEGEFNWTTLNQCKFRIAYNHTSQNISIRGAYIVEQVHQIYFTSIEIAEQAVQVIGEDRILKYLFGVEGTPCT